MTKLDVTVDVDLVDVKDVLAMVEGADGGWDEHVFDPINDHWLAAYQDSDDERKKALWLNMPASLQWCIHELEQRGVWRLKAFLLEYELNYEIEQLRANALPPDVRPPVSGHCPACGNASLVLGSTGHVECEHEDCAMTDAVDLLLSDEETEHVVRFEDDRFHVKHPLRERIGDALLNCTVYTSIHDDPPGIDSGLYRVTVEDGGLIFRVMP